MLHGLLPLYVSVVEALKSLGEAGLFLVTWLDSTILPIPFELVFLPLSFSNPKNVFIYAFIGFTSSTLAGIFSFSVGEKIGHDVLRKKITPQKLEKVVSYLEKKGFFPTLVASFAVPFKFFTIVSGALHVPRQTFLFAVLVSRAAWFFTKAFILFRTWRINF